MTDTAEKTRVNSGSNAAPKWLVDYMRMIEEWAEAFDRDAIHLTQEEYDALSNDLQLAGLEGLE